MKTINVVKASAALVSVGTSFSKQNLENYGLGLGLRSELRAQTLSFFGSSENKAEKLIEWLEIVPENYLEIGGKKARDFQEVLDSGIQLIPHGVNLSVGTASNPDSAHAVPASKIESDQASCEPEPSLDMDLVSVLKDELFTKIKPPWFSDHLSCTRVDGIYLNELIPLPFTREAVDQVVANVKALQEEVGLPFLVENPSYYTSLIEPEMPEYEFMNKIADGSDCGILLDVNNVYVNAINHNYDPKEFIDNLNLDRVVQVHIAGHLEDYVCSDSGELLRVLDTHGESIKSEVYELLDYLLMKTQVNAILLERDSNFTSFEDVISELREIRKIMDKHALVGA